MHEKAHEIGWLTECVSYQCRVVMSCEGECYQGQNALVAETHVSVLWMAADLKGL